MLRHGAITLDGSVPETTVVGQLLALVAAI